MDFREDEKSEATSREGTAGANRLQTFKDKQEHQEEEELSPSREPPVIGFVSFFSTGKTVARRADATSADRPAGESWKLRLQIASELSCLVLFQF